MNHELQNDLAALFNKYGYQWRINDELQTPSATDIRQTLDKAKTMLYAESNESSVPQLEVGRLIIQRNKDFFDIYLLIGSEPTTEETQ